MSVAVYDGLMNEKRSRFMRDQVSISPTFYAHLFGKKANRAISLVTFQLCNFWCQNFVEKPRT